MVFDLARYDYTNALFQLSIRLSKDVEWKAGGSTKEGRRKKYGILVGKKRRRDSFLREKKYNKTKKGKEKTKDRKEN